MTSSAPLEQTLRAPVDRPAVLPSSARLARFADLDDQVEATRRVFASDSRWTVVRGSKLKEGAGAIENDISSTRRPRSSAARAPPRSRTPDPWPSTGVRGGRPRIRSPLG
jgi:hypothetical protein